MIMRKKMWTLKCIARIAQDFRAVTRASIYQEQQLTKNFRLHSLPPVGGPTKWAWSIAFVNQQDHQPKENNTSANVWRITKSHFIAEHEVIPSGLKIKYRHKTAYFDSHWTAWVDYCCEHQVSSEEYGEENEEDSDYEPESDSESESEESHVDEDDDDDFLPELE